MVKVFFVNYTMIYPLSYFIHWTNITSLSGFYHNKPSSSSSVWVYNSKFVSNMHEEFPKSRPKFKLKVIVHGFTHQRVVVRRMNTEPIIRHFQKPSYQKDDYITPSFSVTVRLQWQEVLQRTVTYTNQFAFNLWPCILAWFIIVHTEQNSKQAG